MGKKERMQKPELIPGNCAMYVISHFIKKQDSGITINGLELDSEIAMRNDGQDLFRKELELFFNKQKHMYLSKKGKRSCYICCTRLDNNQLRNPHQKEMQ